MASTGEKAAKVEETPGEPRTIETTMLSKGASLMQNLGPINMIHQHLVAFHFYADDMGRQVEAHHYCSHLNEDVIQCAIYDSDSPGARLIGVEYLISEKLFLGLPDEEKVLWHSHEFEVKGGSLVMPHALEMAEQAEMKRLVKTYGKIWQLWQFDRGDALPMGPPALMSAFTAEDQIDPELLRRRDERYHLSYKDKAEKRKDLPGLEHGIHPKADFWKTGKSFVCEMKETEFKGLKEGMAVEKEDTAAGA